MTARSLAPPEASARLESRVISAAPRWIRYGPAAVLILRAIQELLVSPVFSDSRRSTANPLVSTLASPDHSPARTAMLLSYGAIGAGMLVARLVADLRGGRISPSRADTPAGTGLTLRPIAVLAAIGVAGALGQVAFLLTHGSTLGALFRRAAFTNEASLENPLYGAMSLAGSLLLIASLLTLSLSGGSARRVRAGLALLAFYVSYQGLLGSRAEALVGLFCGALVFHATVRKLRLRHGLAGALAVVLLFSVVGYFRFGSASGAIPGLVSDTRLAETDFMLNAVPTPVPHSGYGIYFGGLSHALPGVVVPGAQNTWRWVILHRNAGVDPYYSGNGGANFSATAEGYLADGYRGVLVAGLVMGLFFGCLFLWLRRAWRNPLATPLLALAFAYFTLGVSSRPGTAVATVLTIGILPIAFVAWSSVRSGRSTFRLVLASWWAGTLMVAIVLSKRTTLPIASELSDGFKVALVVGTCVLYLGCAKWLRRIAPKQAQLRSPVPSQHISL